MGSKMCMRCRGQKKVLGTGWMEEECSVCNGVGRVMDAPINESVTESLERIDSFDNASPSPAHPKHKGGRKKA